MNIDQTIIKIAIVYLGDAEARMSATVENNRFAPLFAEFAKMQWHDHDDVLTNVHAEPAVYHPTLVDDVKKQLSNVDAVLVWVNPIEGGYDRGVLNSMLRDVSMTGRVYVSAHPDVIHIMGTKDILVKMRHMTWGIEDTVSYDNLHDMRAALTPKLANGKIRVLKRNRGQRGNGVWLVQRQMSSNTTTTTCCSGGESGGTHDDDEGGGTTMRVAVKHAARGGLEQIMMLKEFFDMLIDDYHCLMEGDADTRIIDMAYQERLSEGMVRAYMVHDKVGGFGYRELNALHPTAELGPTGPPPQKYYPPDLEGTDVLINFHPLRRKLEDEWLPRLLDVLGMTSADTLPVLWDADFMSSGIDTYVLCEINMSCVFPFPDSARPLIAKATVRRALIARSGRGPPIV